MSSNSNNAGGNAVKPDFVKYNDDRKMEQKSNKHD